MNLFRELKWAAQRVYRGWDDRVIWSIDMYLAKMLPIWLRKQKEQKLGIPPLVLHGDEIDIEESEKAWNDILDKMIEGFEAALCINEGLSVWDELHDEEMRRYGRLLLPWNKEDVREMDRLYTELDFWRKYQEQRDELMLKFKRGMTLFTEHFFSLWD